MGRSHRDERAVPGSPSARHRRRILAKAKRDRRKAAERKYRKPQDRRDIRRHQ